MITELNLPNVLVNGGVVVSSLTFAGWMFKRWMNSREKNEADIRCELVSATAQIAHDLADKHEKSVAEIKDKIQSNREFYTESYGDIKKSIDKLAEHVATTNGSIGKLKETTAGIISTCEERSRVFYQEGVIERRNNVDKPKLVKRRK